MDWGHMEWTGDMQNELGTHKKGLRGDNKFCSAPLLQPGFGFLLPQKKPRCELFNAMGEEPEALLLGVLLLPFSCVSPQSRHRLPYSTRVEDVLYLLFKLVSQ